MTHVSNTCQTLHERNSMADWIVSVRNVQLAVERLMLDVQQSVRLVEIEGLMDVEC